MKKILSLLLFSFALIGMQAAELEGQMVSMRKKNTSFNVGQLYIGGHMGFAVPTAIGEDDKWTFKDAAKTGFVIYADVMRQMNQAVGLGGEIGFRNYPYNDQKFLAVNSQYGTYESKFRALDFDLTGRVFFSTNSVRPFLGIFAGGELIMNQATFVPKGEYLKYTETDYKKTNLSPLFGVMAGAYFKVGKRTLLSVQGRLAIVPTVKSEVQYAIPENYPYERYSIHPVAHEKQTNVSITVGLHVGRDRKNQH